MVDGTVIMDPAEVKRRISEFEAVQPWNHNFDLGGGIETRPGEQVSFGKNRVKLKRLIPLFEKIGLKDRSVLDMGCNEGFFSFYMAESGARVLGIDIDTERISKAEFVKSVKNAENVEFRNLSIYSDEFRNMKSVDLCLCLGFLHRIPDPFTAVAALAEKTDMIIFEWKALKFGPHEDAFAYFSFKDIDRKDYYGTEYWLLSFNALERILKRVGFSYFYRVDEAYQNRAILVAGKSDHNLFHQPDVVVGRSRIRTFLSHTKRYVKTVAGIVTGAVNA